VPVSAARDVREVWSAGAPPGKEAPPWVSSTMVDVTGDADVVKVALDYPSALFTD
jgi:hypothetical protein